MYARDGMGDSAQAIGRLPGCGPEFEAHGFRRILLNGENPMKKIGVER